MLYGYVNGTREHYYIQLSHCFLKLSLNTLTRTKLIANNYDRN